MLNRDLKSLQSLWLSLASVQRYADLVSERDVKTFTERSDKEGLTFLTTVLPRLGKALDEFHSSKEWIPPAGFSRTKDGIPKFLGKPIELALRGNSLAVDCVRQLSYVFYKLEVPYSQDLVEDFLINFRLVDRDLPSLSVESLSDETWRVIREARKLISRILCNTNPKDIRPSHGGGATACRTKNWDKWHKLRYFPSLDAVYPYSDIFFYNFTHLLDEWDYLEKCEEGVNRARVCLVPKDSRGPRVISCEPAEHMYVQQGLMRLLYRTIEDHELTAGHVNFVDQSINQRLAQDGSIHNHLATLDLKDASDRVSLALVRELFPPNWLECLEACRSVETTLPDGEIVKLNKFAPMGSSVCFPVEALVFWAIARASIHVARDRYDVLGILSEGGLLQAKEHPVYVYGDDIIIPSYCYDEVVRGLTSVGLLVNANKSFRDGPFRESCGGDYHRGIDVTPIRIRKVPVINGTGLVASADLANIFIAKFGYADAGAFVREIEQMLGYVFPRTDLPLPGTIRMNPSASNDAFFRRRWNNHLQRFEYRILSAVSKVLTKHAPNWGELLRKELTRKESTGRPEPYCNPLAIADSKLDPGQYTDPHSVRLTWTWVWLGQPAPGDLESTRF